MNGNYESDRISLRGFRPTDYRDMYEYLSLEIVAKYEPYNVQSLEDCKKEAKERSGNPSYLAIEHKLTGKVIGNIYFNQKQPYRLKTWELGYVLNPNYWGAGYATEAVNLIFDYAFNNMRVHRIVASCNPENTRSWKLMERVGMRRESHAIKDVFFKYNPYGAPDWQDSYTYAILIDEYTKTREQ